MSTKIYNGYMLQLKNPTLFNINSVLNHLSDKIKEKARTLYVKKIADIVTDYIDSVTFGKMPLYADEDRFWKISAPLPFAVHTFNRNFRKIYATQERDPWFDLDCEIHIYPLKSKVLLIAHAEQEEFIKIIKEHPSILEYGYWNNTDRPDDISAKEWRTRRTNWEEAFKSKGYTFRCVGEYGLPISNITKDVVAALPTIEDRAQKIAFSNAVGDSMKHGKTFFEAMDWVKNTEEGKVHQQTIASNIANRLKEITLDNLNNSFPEEVTDKILQTKKDQLIEELNNIQYRLVNGCGNHGCIIKQPTGVGTNGGCRCSPKELANTLVRIAEQLKGVTCSEFVQKRQGNLEELAAEAQKLKVGY